MEYKKKCENPDCDNKFTTPYPFRKFCSDACRQKMTRESAKAKHAASEARYTQCKICGKRFRKNKESWVYCSDECRKKDKRTYTTTFDCECQHCHRIFKSVIEDKKFCSARCRSMGVKRNTMSIDEIARAAERKV